MAALIEPPRLLWGLHTMIRACSGRRGSRLSRVPWRFRRAVCLAGLVSVFRLSSFFYLSNLLMITNNTALLEKFMAGSLERVAQDARVAQYTGFMVSVGKVFVYVRLCLLPGALPFL
jgi:hypothetical protein